MGLYLNNTMLVRPPSGGGGGGALAVTFQTDTPEINTAVVSGDVAASTPISAADSVRYTFDYVKAGTGTGSAVTTTGAFGAALNATDVASVLANTGIILTGTYGSIGYEHPLQSNHDSGNNGTFPGDSGIMVDEGVVQGVEIRTEVLQGGSTVVYDQTEFKTYIQIMYDNATRDTNDNFSGSLYTPGGIVLAWTNFPDAGGVVQTTNPYQTGQLPAAGLNSSIANEVLGTGTATDYSTWFTTNTGNPARAEYSYTNHGWHNDGTGGYIWFEIDGTRTQYPNAYSNNAGPADTEWENFFNWALLQADPSLALSGANIQNIMGIERRTHEAEGNFTDRQGNTGRLHYALARQRLGDPNTNTMDNNWGGHATSCYIPGNAFINATNDGLPATPKLGSMWHLSESGDYIEFIPKRYFR